MEYNEFKKMMDTLRSEVKRFCLGGPITLDEAIYLENTMVDYLWFKFGRHNWNFGAFSNAVINATRNEILRVRT